MLSSDFIINKYHIFKVFNIWNKYKYTPIDFIFDNDWKEICDKDRIITLINEISNIIYYEGSFYKLSNGIYISINDKNNLVKNYLLRNGENHVLTDKMMKWLFVKMLNIARHNHITLLDAFICANFSFTWSTKYNNADSTSIDYNKLDDEVLNLYKYARIYTNEKY